MLLQLYLLQYMVSTRSYIVKSQYIFDWGPANWIFLVAMMKKNLIQTPLDFFNSKYQLTSIPT